MRNFFLFFLFLNFISCGQYSDTKVDLRPDQIEAIQDHLTQECITKNADLFNQISNRTVDFANADLSVRTIYTYQETGKDPADLIVLKKTATAIYVFVEKNASDRKNRFYKYTTTDNANHMAKVKSSACSGGNTFTGDSNEFKYTANIFTPDQVTEDRSEYVSNYTVAGSRPIFFSLFNRSYSNKVYTDDAITDDTDVTVTYTPTASGIDIEDYETIFNDGISEHCTFDSVAPTWLDADYPTDFAETVECAANNITWAEIESTL